jgi:hypothetical protein
MSRRADPERILQAHRAAIRNRLTMDGLDAATAERWCDAWEIEAAGREGLARDGAYWDADRDWIALQRAAKRQPAGM